ncbi:MAG: trehalose-phosphatase [Intrasporangium sp.]|uniref:trehalose-phosphatase n=1 Tax=Intrasporangium sp. TaxID=1925024 RepID=UPI002647C23F|nr:trehalose-phosphatase [Intrasporangium sp.]MDN5796434.1 trehalose-phosphatase [Intrasporangium sp.]
MNGAGDLGAAAGDGLGAALEAAAGAEPLLVATDFDGVIAPFARDPMSVRPTHGVMQTLRDLAAQPRVRVALVSGRDLATLRRLSGLTPVDAVVLVGSHGAQSSDPSVESAMGSASVSAEDLVRLDELESQVRALVGARHPRARVERKAAGVVVHTRGLPDAIAGPALDEAAALGGDEPGVRVLAGKSVVELSVSAADKGTALLALSAAVHPRARVYLGDDVTDEDVFVRFEEPTDVTVKVGAGRTAARFRVPDTDAVAALLTQLLAERSLRG